MSGVLGFLVLRNSPHTVPTVVSPTSVPSSQLSRLEATFFQRLMSFQDTCLGCIVSWLRVGDLWLREFLAPNSGTFSGCFLWMSSGVWMVPIAVFFYGMVS